MNHHESDELVHRLPADVARRCVALLAVIDRSYAQDPSDLYDWVKRFDLASFFSVEESEFFYSASPSSEDIIKFGWRAEALVPLLWALKRIPSMPPLNAMVDLSKYNAVQEVHADPQAFVSSANLRTPAELEVAEAAVYQEHWRVRDAQLFRKPCPPELDPDVVYERRYGLSWLVGWGDNWDEVPTDT